MEYNFKKSNLGHCFKKGGKNKKNELILKNVKVEFEFALRVGVGDINECRLKKFLRGFFFSLNFREN